MHRLLVSLLLAPLILSCSSNDESGLEGITGLEPISVEFQAADEERRPGFKTTRVLRSDIEVYVSGEARLTAADIARAEVGEGNQGLPTVQLTLTSAGAEKFARLTEENLGKRVAMMVNGTVVCAPVVRAVIRGGRAVLNGAFTVQEAETIARALNGAG